RSWDIGSLDRSYPHNRRSQGHCNARPRDLFQKVPARFRFTEDQEFVQPSCWIDIRQIAWVERIGRVIHSLKSPSASALDVAKKFSTILMAIQGRSCAPPRDVSASGHGGHFFREIYVRFF